MNAKRATTDEFLSEWGETVRRSARPLILAGGGIRSGQVVDRFRDLVDLLEIPVVHSLMGVDLLPFHHPRRVGMIGTYGNRWANMALGKCDCLLVIGSRLDVRQTGSDAEIFGRGKRIFHVDCEMGEMNNRVRGCRTLLAEVEPFLDAAIAHFKCRSETIRPTAAWIREIEQARLQSPDDAELAGVPSINPNRLMHALSAASQSAAAFVADVGQHQMWAAQSLRLHAGQRFLTSGGMGSMGFALPAAIGAAVAVATRPSSSSPATAAFSPIFRNCKRFTAIGCPSRW